MDLKPKTDRCSHCGRLRVRLRPAPPQRFSDVGSKDAHGFVAAEVAATSANLLTLNKTDRRRPGLRSGDLCHQFHFGSDTMGIRSSSLERDGDARSGGIISIKTGHPVHIVNHNVQVSIVVEVGKSHSLAYAGLVKAPISGGVFKCEVATITKGLFG